MSGNRNVVIVGGCGHVGLPLGIVLASRGGAQVALLDIDPGRVDTVNRGCMPFLEAGAEEILKQVIGKNLRAKVSFTTATWRVAGVSCSSMTRPRSKRVPIVSK